MAIIRLYLPSTALPHAAALQEGQTGQVLSLSKEASHHAITVLRRKVGDEVQLFDGRGYEWLAEIAEITKKQTTLTLKTPLPAISESPLFTHLGIALFRNERFDFALQKAVELGINRITPLITDHVSLKQSPSHLAKRQQHWKNCVIAACEQSRRSHLPVLDTVTHFDDWIQTGPKSQRQFILHPPLEQDHQDKQPNPLGPNETPPESLTFMSGPEGGFSTQEVQTAVSKGFETVSLGRRILRAETAPLAFLSITQSLWGDL